MRITDHADQSMVRPSWFVTVRSCIAFLHMLFLFFLFFFFLFSSLLFFFSFFLFSFFFFFSFFLSFLGPSTAAFAAFDRFSASLPTGLTLNRSKTIALLPSSSRRFTSLCSSRGISHSSVSIPALGSLLSRDRKVISSWLLKHSS